MADQTADVREEIKRTEKRLEMLRDLDVLDAEFRLIKTEYLQRRQELCLRLERADAEAPDQLPSGD